MSWVKLPCPDCPDGYLHDRHWDPSCDVALVDPDRYPGLTFKHCHQCGRVMPDDQRDWNYYLRDRA